MLDDLRTLRDAIGGYRAATTAAGLTWPDHADAAGGQPPDLVYQVFDVDHVAEQLVWLHAQGWVLKRLWPSGGWLMPWPTDVDEALANLSLSLATPFTWRHQLPLFRFDFIIYTFVLAGDREGEIWRYEIDPDTSHTMRAATSLAALFTEWTKGFAAGIIYADDDKWLHVGEDIGEPFDMIVERAPDLDPFAFPESITDVSLLRARQRECGVDMDRIEDPETHSELGDAIDATRASLGL